MAEQVAILVEGAFEGGAHALLMFIYKAPARPMDLRLNAAKAAVRFEKPLLASATLKGDAEHPIEFVLFGVREPATPAEWLAENALAAAV